MTIKELLVLFKFNVDSPSFNNAQALLSRLEQMAQELEGLRPMGKDKFEGFNDGAKTAMLGVNALMGKLRMLAGMAGISLTIHGLVQTADQWRTIEGQIRNVVGESESVAEVQQTLYEIAGRTRQSYAQTAGLFTSVSRSAGDLGKSTEEILAFTEDVAMAMRAGGGSAESQAAALVQLGQALGSGALRGDELNSILEQAPVLANTIAQGMGASIGQLRRLGREGKITSEIIFNAVRSQHDALVKQIGNSPLTMPAAYMRVRDAVGRVVYKLNQGYNIVGKMAEKVVSVADAIDEINLDYLIAGLKLIAFWVGTIIAISKGGAIIALLTNIGGHLLFIVRILKQLLGFQVVWGSLEAAIGASVIVFALKWLLILTAVFVVLEDIYQWFTGGESMIGSWFGPWEEAINNIKSAWESVRESFNYAIHTPIADLVKDLIKWIEDLQTKIAAFDIRGKVGKWWDENVSNPFNDGLGNIIKGSMHEGPQLSAAQIEAYRLVADGGSTTNNRSMTNSGNTTNHITITAPNGSAEAIATAVSDVLPGNPSYDLME